MENVAYTEAYSIYRQGQEMVFCKEYLQREEKMLISSQYRLIKHFFGGAVGKFMLHATENILEDKSGKVIYTWRNINNDGDFCKIIEHNDGHQYLIFRIDLYGYSLLDLKTQKDFHYIPDGSFLEGETFIWTNVFYNNEANVLAVSGCYWACPYGTFLLDFSSPMHFTGNWIDVQEHIASGYEQYDDVDFMKWDGMDLVLNALNNESESEEIITIPSQEYMKWLSEK